MGVCPGTTALNGCWQPGPSQGSYCRLQLGPDLRAQVSGHISSLQPEPKARGLQGLPMKERAGPHCGVHPGPTVVIGNDRNQRPEWDGSGRPEEELSQRGTAPCRERYHQYLPQLRQGEDGRYQAALSSITPNASPLDGVRNNCMWEPYQATCAFGTIC